MKKKKRAVCIFCGRRRFQDKMIEMRTRSLRAWRCSEIKVCEAIKRNNERIRRAEIGNN